MNEERLSSIADNPLEGGLLPHLKLPIEADVPDLFFLPGDPGRLKLFEELSDTFTTLNENREFSLAVGTYHGKRFGVCSTGIGGGSTEIVMVELRELGVKKVVRVGGCGAIDADIPCGSVILNSGCVRLGGSSHFYVRPEYPAVANPFMLAALYESAKRSGKGTFVGIGATVNSYYAGQSRRIPVISNLGHSSLLEEMRTAHVLNFDMETETIFTLAGLFGMKSANILAVHGNRSSNLWLTRYREVQLEVIKIALEANFEEIPL
ncbi:MAG: nucleoside phosphorylase [Thermotogaceae bacterium]|nr:nucleoside phosphorylase [Thermotogaceae bacterium]HPM20369.1 nucleoside phosphorylase [Thermotogota bacterium]